MPYNVQGGYINWQEKKSQLQIIEELWLSKTKTSKDIFGNENWIRNTEKVT